MPSRVALSGPWLVLSSACTAGRQFCWNLLMQQQQQQQAVIRTFRRRISARWLPDDVGHVFANLSLESTLDCSLYLENMFSFEIG